MSRRADTLFYKTPARTVSRLVYRLHNWAQHHVRQIIQFVSNLQPTGLWARSLLILFLPIMATAVIAASVFYDSYRDTVTQKLSSATVRDIALIAELRMRAQGGDDILLSRLASDIFDMSVAFLPGTNLPEPSNTSVISLLHDSLTQEIKQQIGGRPFWLDTVTYENDVDIRILLPGEVMRVLAQRDNVQAGNTAVFMIWLFGTAFVVLLISTLFLRNQVRPIERLATAAEDFGKGRDRQHFVAGGASEVRRAAHAFIEMRERIERQIEQRTLMLSGVSHDLRTPLTRIRLGLATLDSQDEDIRALEVDVDEMSQMLDEYLDFARGDQSELAIPIAIDDFLEQIRSDVRRQWPDIHLSLSAQTGLVVPLRPKGLRRCVINLVNNACAHAKRIDINAIHDSSDKRIDIIIDDNGAGIPEDKMEDVFRPFFRLDAERSVSGGGTGLGLPTARIMAQSLGGDITLAQSPLGGLRAQVTIPL